MTNKLVFSGGILHKKFVDFWSNRATTLNSLLMFLSVSSIWIGITGFFLIYIIYTILELKPNIEIGFVVSLVVFSVYSLNKFTDMDEDAINMPQRIRFISRRKNIVLFSALSAYILSIVITVLVKPSAIPIVFIPLVTNAIYSSKLIPGIPRLKDVPVMKNFFVALSWALVAVLFPTVGTTDLNKIVLITFYFVLVKYFINTVMFDIRDINGDREAGVKTLPVIMGVRRTLIILLAINSTLLLLIPFVPDAAKLLIAVMALYGYVYMIYFRKRRNPLQLDFFVDGEWVMASILYIAFM